MGLFDSMNQPELPVQAFGEPTQEEREYVSKKLTKIIRKRVTMLTTVCGVLALMVVLLIIGCFSDQQGFEMKKLITILLSTIACCGGIWYTIKFKIPENKLIYQNFKNGKFHILTVEPKQVILRIMRDGKENQHGIIEYVGTDGRKISIATTFLHDEVRVYSKNRKELVKAQAIQIEGCKDAYGLLYFQKKGFFY